MLVFSSVPYALMAEPVVRRVMGWSDGDAVGLNGDDQAVGMKTD